MRPVPRCLIALGGNVGPVDETIAAAIRLLDARGDTRVVSASSIHRSIPVGDRAGGEFRNAAAEIETQLPPLELLDALQAVESQFGRTREIHWGPRTLDLDLILYGPEIIRLPRLQVPHPACWYRRFVLDPLVEIAPDVVHPDKQRTFAQLRERLLVRPLPVGLCGGADADRAAIIEALKPEFPDVSTTQWQPGCAEPALLAWLGPGPQTLVLNALPLVARLDASCESEEPGAFLRHVLYAALGR
jgi:2-amino-4-hydroxy-6-hydroxymethyldihydropteridine diphosphokinase